MATLTRLFTFTYSFDDDSTLIKTVQLTYDEQLKNDLDNYETNSFGEKFYEFITNLEEEYGVHDVGYCPDEELCGYNSYEIEKDKVEEHWQKILDFFKAVGADYVVVGPETSVTEREEGWPV
jgi:hypothetical protein